MVGYRSEEEQIEQIRRWWGEYGRSVIAGVIIALLAVFGWQQWRSHQVREELAASDDYQALVADLGDGNTAAAQTQAGRLQSEHEDSPYAVLATFQLADQDVKKKDLKSAAKELRWAKQHAGSPVLEDIARLRLARALFGAGDDKAALKELQPVPKGAFAGQYQELIGDIHAVRSEHAAAIEAYRAALADPLIEGRRRALIQAKLNDLGAQAESAL